MLFVTILSLCATACQSFAPTFRHHQFQRPTNIINHRARSPLMARGGLADPEQGEESKTSSWTRVGGGYLPNLRNRTNPSKRTSIRDVESLVDFKRCVVDSDTKLTVVRFYAPWCRACKANQPLFRKLAAAYETNANVQFVQVPLNQNTAALQQGLGIPSLPYGHIYHADAGLVEERKISKQSFAIFEQVLHTYAQGFCDATYDENDPVLLP